MNCHSCNSANIRSVNSGDGGIWVKCMNCSLYEHRQDMSQLHDATAATLKHFEYKHLPDDLRKVSRQFSTLATKMALTLKGPEVTHCLRKLLEAKDCAVRAAITARPPDA